MWVWCPTVLTGSKAKNRVLLTSVAHIPRAPKRSAAAELAGASGVLRSLVRQKLRDKPLAVLDDRDA